MNEEKRMIDIYEVKTSIRFCGKEYILGEDKSGKTPEPYMTCITRRDNPFGIEEYTNVVISDDYLEIFNLFIDRLSEQSKQLSSERAERGVTSKPLTAENCIKDGLNSDIEGKIIIIKPTSLLPEYRTADRQIRIATGGFGCQPNARGNAVFCTDIYSDKHSRFEKYDVLGVADINLLPEWVKQKIAEYEKAHKSKEKPSVLKELDDNKTTVSAQKSKKPKKQKKEHEEK